MLKDKITFALYIAIIGVIVSGSGVLINNESILLVGFIILFFTLGILIGCCERNKKEKA